MAQVCVARGVGQPQAAAAAQRHAHAPARDHRPGQARRKFMSRSQVSSQRELTSGFWLVVYNLAAANQEPG